MTDDDVGAVITAFVRDRFLDGDVRHELTDTTPLLEWGVLNSLNTAELLGFLRDELDVNVPPQFINAENFRDIVHITALVADLRRRAENGPEVR